MGSGVFLRLVARNSVVLAGPLVTLAYPLHASVKAIESKSPLDDQQWLTYWVLYSLLTLFELTFAKLIEWIPFWSYSKLIFNCWLVLPHFNGAAYIYEQYVRPLVLNHQALRIWFVPLNKGTFHNPDDILRAAQKYIKQNGPEAFETLVNKAGGAPNSSKAEKEANPRRRFNKLMRFDKVGAEKVSRHDP